MPARLAIGVQAAFGPQAAGIWPLAAGQHGWHAIDVAMLMAAVRAARQLLAKDAYRCGMVLSKIQG